MYHGNQGHGALRPHTIIKGLIFCTYMAMNTNGLQGNTDAICINWYSLSLRHWVGVGDGGGSGWCCTLTGRVGVGHKAEPFTISFNAASAEQQSNSYYHLTAAAGQTIVITHSQIHVWMGQNSCNYHASCLSHTFYSLCSPYLYLQSFKCLVMGNLRHAFSRALVHISIFPHRSKLIWVF